MEQIGLRRNKEFSKLEVVNRSADIVTEQKQRENIKIHKQLQLVTSDL